jgi:hypothetical protein
MVEMESNYKHHVKNGSFRVVVPMCRRIEDGNGSYVNCFFPKDYEQVDAKSYIVQMLTQNDYADGWRQVVPNAKRHSKTYKDLEGNEIVKTFSNVYKMKVNLAQLPEYLWHRMQYVDENTKSVRNGIHHYIIDKSNVDDEIRELASILNQHVDTSHRERVHELLNILKDNDVYGWLVIRAKSMYK